MNDISEDYMGIREPYAKSMPKCQVDTVDRFFLIDRVYAEYAKYPYITAKGICKAWTETRREAKNLYNNHGKTIKTYLWKIRKKRWQPKKGLPLTTPQTLPHKRVFRWEGIGRELLPEGVRGGFVKWKGWRVVDNRNQQVVFEDVSGSVHWWPFSSGGKDVVVLYLKGALQEGRAKALFAKAFQFLSNEAFGRFLDRPLREESRHWVFKVGKRLTPFVIRQFEKDNGIIISSDSSHPGKLEVHQKMLGSAEERVLVERQKAMYEERLLVLEKRKLAEVVRRNEREDQFRKLSFDPRRIYLGHKRWWDPVSNQGFIRVGGNRGYVPGDREGSPTY